MRFRNTNILTPEGQDALQNVKSELINLPNNVVATSLIELIDLVSKSTLSQLLMSPNKILKLLAVIDGGTGGCFIPVVDDTTRQIAEIVLKHTGCFRVKNAQGCLTGINNEILKATESLSKLDLNDFSITVLANYEAEKVIYDAGSTKTDTIMRKLHSQDLRRMQDPEAHANQLLAEVGEISCLSVTYIAGSNIPIKSRCKAAIYADAMDSECQAISKKLIHPNDNFVMQAVTKLLDPDAIKKYDSATTSMINKLISDIEQYKLTSTGEKTTFAETLLLEIKRVDANKQDDAFTKLNKLESLLSHHLHELTFGRLYNLILDSRAQCILQMQKQEPSCDAWLEKKVAELRVKYQELAANPVEPRGHNNMLFSGGKKLAKSTGDIPRKKF
jgi:hypothetical protein